MYMDCNMWSLKKILSKDDNYILHEKIIETLKFKKIKYDKNSVFNNIRVVIDRSLLTFSLENKDFLSSEKGMFKVL